VSNLNNPVQSPRSTARMRMENTTMLRRRGAGELVCSFWHYLC